MERSALIENVKLQISQGEIKLAFQELQNCKKSPVLEKEFLLLSARFRNLEKKIFQHTLTNDERDIASNMITLALLDWLELFSKSEKTCPKKVDKFESIYSQKEMTDFEEGFPNQALFNDIDSLKEFITQSTNKHIQELKKVFAYQNRELLAKIQEVQALLDEEKAEEKIQAYTKDLDEFWAEVNRTKIEAAKKRLLRNYGLIREYEDLLLLEDDPRRKQKYEVELDALRLANEKEEKALGGIKN